MNAPTCPECHKPLEVVKVEVEVTLPWQGDGYGAENVGTEYAVDALCPCGCYLGDYRRVERAVLARLPKTLVLPHG